MIVNYVTCNSPGLRYTSGSQVHVAPNVLEGTSNLSGPRYTYGSQVHIAPHVLRGLECICNPPDPRYTPGSQVHVAHPVSSGLEDTCNLSGLKYKLELMFEVEKGTYNAPSPRHVALHVWVDQKIPTTFQVPGKCRT